MNKYLAQEMAFKNGYKDGKDLTENEIDLQYSLGFALAQKECAKNLIVHFEQTIKYLQQKKGKDELVLKLRSELDDIKSTM